MPDLVISPGLVDTHVHINEPGRTEWEGFDTATRAAACGGVTTLVDMPLNSVPATTCVAALHAKMGAARAQCHVDVGFWGGVVPGNAPELDPLIDAGVRGFKCFLVPSGVDEFPPVTEDDLRRALPILARRNMPLLVHAGTSLRIATTATGDPQCTTAIRLYLASRPVSDGAGRHPPADPAGRGIPDAHPRRARVVGRRRRGDCRRQGGLGADHRGDLSALPDVRGRRDPRRRHAVQVRAADSRGVASPGAVGAAGERGAGFDRHRSLALAARAQDARRFLDARGAGSRRWSCRCPPSGPRTVEAVGRGVPPPVTQTSTSDAATDGRSAGHGAAGPTATSGTKRGLAVPALSSAAQTAARVDLADG